MTDAFISHSSADAALAGRIERMLEEHRCRVLDFKRRNARPL